ncbi:NAD-dependent epimerase/dehydratase family protein [Sphingobacterium olei]|uniref:NAD-dependent epimerase/dehydratase family protein n=1 Tax=Sphingobacterium olei TaxID=2571155 RepID=A0A4U0NGJ1_9SPHI|nr:NAD(P)H-binding protein [Sphingobacterium olei]TJZ53286.1 NAD-dependent epimerase/dehydratase family protein [Sphingobacterium olei]
MQITITGSLGNIGSSLTRNLVKAGHEVIVITSNENRTIEIEALGAKAAVGSVSDAHFLTEAFSGSDAVFAMTPPNLGGENVIANTTKAGKAFATAFQVAGVKRVVMLSSIGADLPNGNGPIEGLYHIEQIYKDLEGIAFTFLRAGYFYTNLYNDIPVIKGMNAIGANYPAETIVPFVHPDDIATAAAEELQRVPEGNEIRYVISDVRSAADVAEVLGTAIGKPTLPWVEFTDEQSLQGMTQAGVPAEIANLYTEMGTGIRTGKIQSDFIQYASQVTGQIKLEEFAKDFAAKF